MPLTNSLLHALDATASSLGPTPRYDCHQNVIPVGTPHAGGKVFPGATFIGRPNLQEAQAAFCRGPSHLREIWRLPRARRAIPTPGVAPPNITNRRHRVGDPAYCEDDFSNIRAKVNTPPAIHIPQDRALNEQAFTRWESMMEQWTGEPLQHTQRGATIETPGGSSSRSISSGALRSHGSSADDDEEQIIAWAVIRGDRLGSADRAAGYTVGIKVVPFTSKTDTFVYFM
ncbi:hypothetical protein LXA43DRAFT_1103011 [Ganoderma leucocontextum]|nr:hypothetical protein LXA43DRAFT_1103011 [Ganoderma leucocontextum]